MSTGAWDHILDPGETIIWQGRPERGIAFRKLNPMRAVMGVVFVVFSTFWMVQAAQTGGVFWMFGLLFLGVGAYNAGGFLLWEAYQRAHMWYSLSSRRAFIATNLPLIGRDLKSYPISRDSVLDFRDGDPAAIYFARDYKRTANGSRQVDVGFERIKDGADVYAKLRAVQRGDYENTV